VDKVRERLDRAASALDAAGVPYVVIGGNAVAAWVATVDESVVRNTQDVDFLLREGDLDQAEKALSAAGFLHRHVAGIDVFLDGPTAKARDAVHVIFAGKKVRPEYETPAPDVEPYHPHPKFRLVPLERLVEMKLNSYRRKDQVHLLDLIQVGLVDESWVEKFPAVLAARLQELLTDPEG